jgi:DNA polymerase-1
VGTRTGRLSSTPNFQNIPNEFKEIFRFKTGNKKLPICPWKDLPELPQVRKYILPFEGDVIIDRDYSQQEPRILAHFDGGLLMDNYIADPWTDLHDYAQTKLAERGLIYERKPVKVVNLGLIYGMGAPLMAERLGITVVEANILKKAVLSLYPGLRQMYSDMRTLAKQGIPIRTWGGREYYCEPPKLVDGRVREFDYKLVNLLIQGSAADCTKEAIIRFYKVREPQWRLILNVHDQLAASVPSGDKVRAMRVLKTSMESPNFDVLMLSEGSTSSTNWGELVVYDKKGIIIGETP